MTVYTDPFRYTDLSGQLIRFDIFTGFFESFCGPSGGKVKADSVTAARSIFWLASRGLLRPHTRS